MCFLVFFFNIKEIVHGGKNISAINLQITNTEKITIKLNYSGASRVRAVITGYGAATSPSQMEIIFKGKAINGATHPRTYVSRCRPTLLNVFFSDRSVGLLPGEKRIPRNDARVPKTFKPVPVIALQFRLWTSRGCL